MRRSVLMTISPFLFIIAVSASCGGEADSGGEDNAASQQESQLAGSPSPSGVRVTAGDGRGGGSSSSGSSSNPFVGTWLGTVKGGTGAGQSLTLVFTDADYTWTSSCGESGTYTYDDTTLTLQRTSGDCDPTLGRAARTVSGKSYTYTWVDSQTKRTLEITFGQIYVDSAELVKQEENTNQGDNTGSSGGGASFPCYGSSAPTGDLTGGHALGYSADQVANAMMAVMPADGDYLITTVVKFTSDLGQNGGNTDEYGPCFVESKTHMYSVWKNIYYSTNGAAQALSPQTAETKIECANNVIPWGANASGSFEASYAATCTIDITMGEGVQTRQTWTATATMEPVEYLGTFPPEPARAAARQGRR